MALGQLHENKGSDQGKGSHQDKDSDKGLEKDKGWQPHGSEEDASSSSLFVSTVLRGLVMKWAPRMRAMELAETVAGVVALSRASGQGLARGGLTSTSASLVTSAVAVAVIAGSGPSSTSRHNDNHDNDNDNDKNDSNAVFKMTATGSGSVGGSGSTSWGGLDWHGLWDGLEASPSGSDLDHIDSTVTIGIDNSHLSSLSLALVSFTTDELARALETMQFFGLGTGLGPGSGIGPGSGSVSGEFHGSTQGQGSGLLLHPRHRDLSVCLQLAVMQTWARSLESLALAHPRATPARTEAWIIRSTRLLHSLGAVCGGWNDWDPSVKGLLAQTLQVRRLCSFFFFLLKF